MENQEYYFKNRTPLAPLRIIAMENCTELGKLADQHVTELRQKSLRRYAQEDPSMTEREYDRETYLIKAHCPRFGSGEAKGEILDSVRGCDLFILTDVTNNNLSFSIYGKTHYMSPDDHYQDLKRIVAAAMTSAYRVNVIMPFLYGGRQHERVGRESLDCATALQELAGMGVANIITFDAHDSRVQNAIPLHDFDNYSPVYQLMKALERHYGRIRISKDDLVIVSPDEGAMSRAVYLANNLGVGMGMFYKRRDYTRTVNGENPVVDTEYIGPDVSGKNVIILDDIISTGNVMLSAAEGVRERGCNKVVLFGTFGLFTDGLEEFDKAYAKGLFNHIVTTNLSWRRPELFEREWYLEADMSRYIGKIINTMNHNVAVSNVITTSERLQRLIRHNSVH